MVLRGSAEFSPRGLRGFRAGCDVAATSPIDTLMRRMRVGKRVVSSRSSEARRTRESSKPAPAVVTVMESMPPVSESTVHELASFAGQRAFHVVSTSPRSRWRFVANFAMLVMVAPTDKSRTRGPRQAFICSKFRCCR